MLETELVTQPGVATAFWRRVDFDGPVMDATIGPCWVWTGSINQRHGYGRLGVGGRSVAAHRLALALTGESIPTELEPDHLCRNRACVRRSHLELVTHAENVRRGSRARPPRGLCPNGHAYGPDTRKRRGARSCDVCHRAARDRYNDLRRAQRAVA